MITSMTGFAARRGAGADHRWTWDLRAVNGKGLDVRLRLPDWIEGLEQVLRADLQKELNRGNVNLTLKVTREGVTEGSGDLFSISDLALDAALSAISRVEKAAMNRGVTLGQPTSADVLALRGVLDVMAVVEDVGPLRSALQADLPALLAEFSAMRKTEGAALHSVISNQLDQIAALTEEATSEVLSRRSAQSSALHEAVARLLSVDQRLDETRLAQELALIIVKSDVQEELDRLNAHIDAARALLSEPGPVGRKLDFLMQEFMREANTLCSKAQDIALTRIGLDLKTVIDQMREQVQNVE